MFLSLCKHLREKIYTRLSLEDLRSLTKVNRTLRREATAEARARYQKFVADACLLKPGNVGFYEEEAGSIMILDDLLRPDAENQTCKRYSSMRDVPDKPRKPSRMNILLLAARKNDLGMLEIAFHARMSERPVTISLSTVNVYHPTEKQGRGDVREEIRVEITVMPGWDERVCLYAAKHGNLDMLRWARAQNPPCPWDIRTCGYAEKNGHRECYEWARENGAPTWCLHTGQRPPMVGNDISDDMLILGFY